MTVWKRGDLSGNLSYSKLIYVLTSHLIIFPNNDTLKNLFEYNKHDPFVSPKVLEKMINNVCNL
jgi:hypothetical protein